MLCWVNGLSIQSFLRMCDSRADNVITEASLQKAISSSKKSINTGSVRNNG